VAAELAQIRLRSSQLPAERGKEQVSGQLAGVQVRDSSWAAKAKRSADPQSEAFTTAGGSSARAPRQRPVGAHLSKSHTTIGTVTCNEREV